MPYLRGGWMPRAQARWPRRAPPQPAPAAPLPEQRRASETAARINRPRPAPRMRRHAHVSRLINNFTWSHDPDKVFGTQTSPGGRTGAVCWCRISWRRACGARPAASRASRGKTSAQRRHEVNRVSAANQAKHLGSYRTRPTFRRSTAFSCRSTSSSASFARSPRDTRTSHRPPAYEPDTDCPGARPQ
jgi:hypothetical protein